MLNKRALGDDHDVVNINNYNVIHVCEDLVHHGLERGRGVAESEEHDSGFVGSSMANKRGFPFVTVLDPDVVVSPQKIYLCEVPRSLELVDELRDEWKRVIVPYCVLVQVPVVLHHPFSSIFLRHEEYGRRLFGLGRANIPFGELFIHEL